MNMNVPANNSDCQTWRGVFFFSSLLLLLVGCSAKPPEQVIKDSKGHTYNWRRHVEPVTAEVTLPTKIPPLKQEQSVLRMSDEQLSEALRPVMNKDKEEYVGEPARELVQRLRAGNSPTKSYAYVPMGVTRLTQKETPPLLKLKITPQSLIIGPDDRQVIRDNTAYPWRTINYHGCSGTMIGPSTALTAAHCVHNGVNWLARSPVAPGTDFQDPNPYPFGQHSCYARTVPNAWIDSKGTDFRFDYAVIEFSGCNDYPGANTGFKGVWAAPDDVILNNTLYVYGHPSDKKQPQIWGASGRSDFAGDEIHFFIDIWHGDSGAGLYLWDTDGWPYLVGVVSHATGTAGNDNHPNVATRITGDVIAFIREYSAL